MAAKKKTPSAADFRKAEEASKKKTSTQTTATYKGQKVDWKTPGKPTEAITNKGQKATGLSKPTTQDRFSSTAKTKLSTGHFANSGNPNSKQFNVTKGNVANAALIAVGGPILKAATGKIAGVVGQKVSTVVEEAAWNAASKGLGASGAGGKVKNVMTPMGKTLGSSSIGSPAQQAARMNNLAANAEKIAYSTSAEVARKAIRGINSAGKIVRVGASGALIANTLAPKKKKK
jgi:hypothetical protein